VIELSGLNGTNGFAIHGIAPMDASGRRVSRVGDINHDGIDDLMLGAPDAAPFNALGAGEGYVIFGDPELGSSGSFELSSLNGANGFMVPGIDPGDECSVVSAAGDVNADGLDDAMIGAPGGNPPMRSNEGRTFIIFGRAPECGGGAADTACSGDLDGDGDTDVFDFGIFTAHFGQSVIRSADGDLDSSGAVGVFDFAILASDFGCFD
jgi:hypothetical protein